MTLSLFSLVMLNLHRSFWHFPILIRKYPVKMRDLWAKVSLRYDGRCTKFQERVPDDAGLFPSSHLSFVTSRVAGGDDVTCVVLLTSSVWHPSDFGKQTVTLKTVRWWHSRIDTVILQNWIPNSSLQKYYFDMKFLAFDDYKVLDRIRFYSSSRYCDTALHVHRTLVTSGKGQSPTELR